MAPDEQQSAPKWAALVDDRLVPMPRRRLKARDILHQSGAKPGRFLIRDVPAGQTYKLRVEAIALNKYREKAVDLTVESAAHEQPILTIELR